MNREKIEKVLELTDQHRDAENDYKRMRLLLDGNEKKHCDVGTKVYYIIEALATNHGSHVPCPPEDREQFFQQVYDVIRKEWSKICDKQLAVVQTIEKELEEL